MRPFNLYSFWLHFIYTLWIALLATIQPSTAAALTVRCYRTQKTINGI